MKTRLGKVVIDVGYVVDLDNERMVQQATDALYADMIHAYQYDEMSGWITTVVTGGLLESDIHDFLLEGDEDE